MNDADANDHPLLWGHTMPGELDATREQVEPLCSHCRFPLKEAPSGLRYFGAHVAHQESDCIRLLTAEIERLQQAGGARLGPTSVMATGTEAAVCQDIARRQALGIAKYGQTVAMNPLPLRDWLQHAYEEALDQAIYLKRAIAEIDAKHASAAPADPIGAQEP